MAGTEYLVDPGEAKMTLGAAGQPTETGWKVVTPRTWHFRNHQIADKTQLVEGYWDKDWWLDCTKAKAVVEIYDANPALSESELSALVDEYMFDNQNIVFRPNEVFVGHWGNDEHAICLDPRYDLFQTLQEMHEIEQKTYIWENGQKVRLDEELFKKIEKFCKKRNFAFKLQTIMSERESKMYFAIARYWEPIGTSGLRANPDHEWYMKQGLRKLVDLMRQTVERLKEQSQKVRTDEYLDIRRRIIDCEASIKATEAVIRWIKRHAEEASEAAKKATDPEDRKRLELIASNCAWVAENPPRTFPEAMQLHWLSFMAHAFIEIPAHTVCFRPDVVFWDWYKKDVINEKNLSREEAGDYVAQYMMKYHELGFPTPLELLKKAGMGTRDYSTLTIGGMSADGKNSTNDLSMLFLDVLDGYRLHYPDIKMRWNKRMNQNDFKRTVEVMRTGMGIPSFRNDDVAMQSFLDQYGDEITVEEARTWGVVGCITPGATINSKGVNRRSAQFINASKPLEFVIFNGVDPEPGFEWGKSIETGDPNQFKDFEEFYQAWVEQWKWFTTTEIKLRNIGWGIMMKSLRRPFISMLYKRCVEEGIDAQLLDNPNLSFQDTLGWVDSVDGLTAVKYWIYDKKKYTMSQLQEALKADWEGYEDMRQDFKEAPKFGNNNDYADDIFIRAVNDANEIARKYVLDERGKPTFPSGLIITFMYLMADRTGALPNGRKRGEPFCDGGINPHAEFDKGGPWDRMASALKVDQSKFKAWIYNQKFDYDSVAGEAGLDKMAEYTLAGLEGGMDQLQYNLMSKDILRDAQQSPEKYPYLSVRISGYSAYFTQLPEFVQNAVIDRQDHEL